MSTSIYVPYWEYFERDLPNSLEVCEVWVEGEFSGHAVVLFQHTTGRYFAVEWFWGSCEGCDIIEDAIIDGIWDTRTEVTPASFKSKYVDQMDNPEQVWGNE